MKNNGKIIKALFMLIIALLFFSCSVKKERYKEDTNMSVAMVEASRVGGASFSQEEAKGINVKEEQEFDAGTYNASNETPDKVVRKLIKRGYIVFESRNIKESYAIIKNMLNTEKGYISSENEYSTSRTQEIDIKIRVPKDAFDSFFEAVEKTAHYVKNKSVDIQDVTEEFIDIEARLKIKKETEETYIRLLGSAKNVRDVLDIQDQVQRIRSEIESIEGRLKYLESAVGFSTVDIHIYQYVVNDEIPTRTSFFTRVLSSLKSGMSIFSEVIIGVLNAWVFIVIGVVILIFINIAIRRKKKKK